MHNGLLWGGVKMETRKPNVCWELKNVQKGKEDIKEVSILMKTLR